MEIRIAALLVIIAAAYAEEFKRYDAVAVKRFEDELRRMGVVLPSLTQPLKDPNTPDPVVSCAAGEFEGHWIQSQFGRPIAAFEGIPYVQPPLGPLRFQVAQPLTTKLLNFKAKQPGPMCIQRHALLKTLDVEGSEDCLFINVYVPEKVQRERFERLPVIFVVHGGAYISGHSHLFGSNVLLDQDVVLVTVNYRLGALGFLTTEDEVIPGNIALKDQVAGLRWVHENIAAFGGNSDLITLLGHSAGAACSDHLMLSPLTKGLFHRVISISGSALSNSGVAHPGEMRKNVRKAAQHLNCPPEPSEDLLACLQSKTAEEITLVDVYFRMWGNSLTLPFKPVVEGDVPGALIPRHPLEMFDDTPHNDVPYMVTVGSEEGSFFAIDMILNETLLREFDENYVEYAQQVLLHNKPPEIMESLRRAYFPPGPFDKSKMMEGSNMFTDIYFIWPVVKSERGRRKRAKSPTYFRYFSYAGSRSFMDFYGAPSVGVTHGDDLFYMFTLPSNKQPTPEDVLMSIIMTDLIASFARDGAPSSNHMKTKWLPVTTKGTDIEYLHIKSPLDISMKKDLFPERMTLLDNLLGESPAKSGQHRQDEL